MNIAFHVAHVRDVYNTVQVLRHFPHDATHAGGHRYIQSVTNFMPPLGIEPGPPRVLSECSDHCALGADIVNVLRVLYFCFQDNEVCRQFNTSSSPVLTSTRKTRRNRRKNRVRN
uniref:Uncharacterized protein n=1 Tax=Cacopsylla melanoneura TaxID=428564 RepID=A0A8D9AHC6_9HEMI